MKTKDNPPLFDDLPEARAAGFRTIHEAAQVAGVSAKMIRDYELVGALKPTERTGAGYRLYAPEDIYAINLIKRCSRVGFSLEQAKYINAVRGTDEAAHYILLARDKIKTLEGLIVDLEGKTAAGLLTEEELTGRLSQVEAALAGVSP